METSEDTRDILNKDDGEFSTREIQRVIKVVNPLKRKKKEIQFR